LNIVKEAIEHLHKHGGLTNLPGWYYDLVVDRLERLGFKRCETISDGPWEGSSYMHPTGTEFKVATKRLNGPMTVIHCFPSSKESSN
jgi:hypothetical protein